MDTFTDVAADLREPTRAFRKAAPDAWSAFSALHQAAVRDGVMPAKVKEMIALAIAVSQHCDGCVAYHARGAANHGATREEVVEALEVALLMNGGPASVWAPRALAAFDEFAASEA